MQFLEGSLVRRYVPLYSRAGRRSGASNRDVLGIRIFGLLLGICVGTEKGCPNAPEGRPIQRSVTLLSRA